MESDRISSLPDDLLTHIVSYLPIEDSIKTSSLSKRWEFVWLKASVLDLTKSVFLPDSNVPEIVTNKFLNCNGNIDMHTFKVKYDGYNIRTFQYLVWIERMINRGIQHLDVETNNSHGHIHYMPKNVFKSKTLVCLKLTNVGITDNPQVLVVSLPCLKIMYLKDIYLDKDGPLITDKLILGCPVLEDLTLIRGHFSDDDVDNLPFLRVKSQTLKIFSLAFNWEVYNSVDLVEIDAPKLRYMSFRDGQSDMIMVKNLSSLIKVDLDTRFNFNSESRIMEPLDLKKRDNIQDFLTGISSVTHIIISQQTLEVLYQYFRIGLIIPKFHNLTHLRVEFSITPLLQLPVFLESYPNLKNLILDWEPEQIYSTIVPQCLTSTLEYVRINKLIMREETWINVVNYFLENSAVLKKVTVSFIDSPMPNKALIMIRRLTSKKLSPRCQVIVDWYAADGYDGDLVSERSLFHPRFKKE